MAADIAARLLNLVPGSKQNNNNIKKTERKMELQRNRRNGVYADGTGARMSKQQCSMLAVKAREGTSTQKDSSSALETVSSAWNRGVSVAFREQLDTQCRIVNAGVGKDGRAWKPERNLQETFVKCRIDFGRVGWFFR